MKVGTLLVKLGKGNTQANVEIRHDGGTYHISELWIRKDGTVVIKSKGA